MEDLVVKEKSQGWYKGEGSSKESEIREKKCRELYLGVEEKFLWGYDLTLWSNTFPRATRIITPAGSSISGLVCNLPAICLALSASCFLLSLSFSLLVFTMFSGANAATGPLIWLKSYCNQTPWEIIFNEQKCSTETMNSFSNTTKKILTVEILQWKLFIWIAC